MINTKIEVINNEYCVLIDFLHSNSLCKKFSSMEEALKFHEEIYLNICLFLMYGTDDKKALEKYSRETYTGPITTQYDYESYKKANMNQLFSREIIVNSNSTIDINGKPYQEINNINDIRFLRNNIKYKYLNLEKIRNILKKILLLKGTKQGGFNLTNLYWDANIPINLVNYLFPELVTSYDESQIKAIRTYTGKDYALFNDLLCGKEINIENITSETIDLIFEMIKCFRPTPYDLYLYRGASSDQAHFRQDNEYVYNQFISTSLSAPSALVFASGEEYQIKIPKGSPVLFIGTSIEKENSIENEVLLLPGKYSIVADKDHKKVLKQEELIDPIRLILDNLVKKKESYIEQIGEQRYQVIYNYVLKKSLEIKKEELTSINNNSQKLTNLLDELQLLIGYYGVHNQKEDHDLQHYGM